MQKRTDKFTIDDQIVNVLLKTTLKQRLWLQQQSFLQPQHQPPQRRQHCGSLRPI
jgi:hypothetical protein